MAKLKYLSDSVVDTLRGNITSNLGRYRSGCFDDLMAQDNWAIELNLDVDLAPLKELDPSGTPESEIANSRLVWRSLHALTPALACVEAIWTRLTHVECLEFSRNRWLSASSVDAETHQAVDKHFFANTLTKRRDDNAVSKLWWNACIANATRPDTDLSALSIILKKADIRLNFVERSLSMSRPAIAAAILRLLEKEPRIMASEDHFRSFMVLVNRHGGGIVFEAMSADEVDAFMQRWAERSMAIVETASAA